MSRIKLLLLAIALTVVSGCSGSSALIKASSTSVRSDVFQELKDGGSIPLGYADLRISFSLKTHKLGIHSAKDVHGTPDYKLLLNVDGQAIQLQGSLIEENNEPHGLRDPEAGEGIRYRFSGNLRMKAGTHKVVIAIPADNIAVEREITLPEGSRNSLVLEPMYRTAPGKRSPGSYGVTSFYEGITGLMVVLNGKSI